MLFLSELITKMVLLAGELHFDRVHATKSRKNFQLSQLFAKLFTKSLCFTNGVQYIALIFANHSHSKYIKVLGKNVYINSLKDLSNLKGFNYF